MVAARELEVGGAARGPRREGADAEDDARVAGAPARVSIVVFGGVARPPPGAVPAARTPQQDARAGEAARGADEEARPRAAPRAGLGRARGRLQEVDVALESLEDLQTLHVVVEEHDAGRGGEAGAKAGAEGGAKGHGTAPQGGRHQPGGGPGQLHGPRLRRDHGLASNGSLSHVP